MAGRRVSRGGGVSRPPVVSGIPGLRWRDAVRLVGWTGRGFLHGARYGRGAGRVYSAVLAVAWVPSTPLLLLGQVIAARRRNVRYYLTPERDVVLAVVARADGWHVTEHTAAAPGAGRGQVLRAAVAPALLQAADAQGFVVHVIAANRGLADRYASELPGLVDVGRGPLRGRRLQRSPRPPSAADPTGRAAVAVGEGDASVELTASFVLAQDPSVMGTVKASFPPGPPAREATGHLGRAVLPSGDRLRPEVER